jgi:hypothetical protein
LWITHVAETHLRSDASGLYCAFWPKGVKVAKLNQIIAVEKGVKSGALRDLTDAHHSLQKPALLSGISRTYQPTDEEGEQLPPESTRVQVKGEEVISRTTAILTRLFDVTATKDWANRDARADVVVDGRTVLSDVPVSYPGACRETAACGEVRPRGGQRDRGDRRARRRCRVRLPVRLTTNSPAGTRGCAHRRRARKLNLKFRLTRW